MLQSVDFFKDEVEYRGHILSTRRGADESFYGTGNSKDDGPALCFRIKIFHWTGFLLQQIYQGFCSKIAKCLFGLLQLKTSCEWTSDCEQTFQLLKEKLSSSLVLAFPGIDGA